MADRVAAVRLSAEVNQFKRDMGQAALSVSQVGSAASYAEKETSKLSKISSGAGKTIAAGLVLAAAGAATLATSVVKTGFNYNKLEQTSRAAMTTLLGSAEAAEGQMTKLSEFVKTALFPRQVFIEAQQRMLSFGFAAEEIIPILDDVQNAVAATGGSAETFNDVVRIISQIRSTGKLTAEDLNQLGERGFNAAKLIADGMGTTEQAIRESITNGTLDATAATQAMTDQMGKQFKGAADLINQTFDGAKFHVQGALRDIGSALAEPFLSKKGGGALIDWGFAATDVLRAFEVQLKEMISLATGEFEPSLQGITDRLEDAAEAIKNWNVKSITRDLKELLPGIAAISGGILTMGTNSLLAATGLGRLGLTINPLIGAAAALAVTSPELRDALGEILAELEPLIPAAIELAEALAQTLTTAATVAAGALGPIADVAAGVSSVFSALPTPIQSAGIAMLGLTQIAPRLNEMSASLTSNFGSFREEMELQKALHSGITGGFNSIADSTERAVPTLSNMGAAAAVAQRGLGTLKGAANGVVNALGGPFGVALIAATVAISAITSAASSAREEIRNLGGGVEQFNLDMQRFIATGEQSALLIQHFGKDFSDLGRIANQSSGGVGAFFDAWKDQNLGAAIGELAAADEQINLLAGSLGHLVSQDLAGEAAAQALKLRTELLAQGDSVEEVNEKLAPYETSLAQLESQLNELGVQVDKSLPKHERFTDGMLKSAEAAQRSKQSILDTKLAAIELAQSVDLTTGKLDIFARAFNFTAEEAAKAQQAWRGSVGGFLDITSAFDTALQNRTAAEQAAAEASANAARNSQDSAKAATDARIKAADASSRAEQEMQKAQEGIAKAEREAAQSAEDSALRVEEARRRVGDAERDAAKTAEDSLRKIADARRSLADAERDAVRSAKDSAEQIAEAQRSVADARAQAADDAVKAAERVRDAEDALVDAQERALDAQRVLSQARRDAITDIRNLREELSDLGRSEESAQISVAEAQQRVDILEAEEALAAARDRLDKINASSKISETQRAKALKDVQDAEIALADLQDGANTKALERQKANLALADAQDRLSDVQKDSKQTQKELNDAERKGVEGSDKVISAKKALAEANEGVRSASQAIKDAIVAERVAQEESAERIREAIASVNSARADAAIAADESSRKIAEAQRGINEAHRDSVQAAADSQLAIAEAQHGVTQAQRDSVQAAEDAAIRIGEAKATSVEASHSYATEVSSDLTSAGGAWTDYAEEVEVTGQDFLEVLRQMEEDQANWADNLISLAGKIPQGLYDELVQAGPQGAAAVAQLKNLTDAELVEAGELWEKTTGTGADKITQQLTEAGSMMAQIAAQAGDKVADKIAAHMIRHGTDIYEAAEALGYKIDDGVGAGKIRLVPIRPELKGMDSAERLLNQIARDRELDIKLSKDTIRRLNILANRGVRVAGVTGQGGVFEASGGPIIGPGGPTSDVIPAWLSNGEYVLRAQAVSRYGLSFLNNLNAMRFASGGVVGEKFQTGGSVKRVAQARITIDPAFAQLRPELQIFERDWLSSWTDIGEETVRRNEDIKDSSSDMWDTVWSQTLKPGVKKDLPDAWNETFNHIDKKTENVTGSIADRIKTEWKAGYDNTLRPGLRRDLEPTWFKTFNNLEDKTDTKTAEITDDIKTEWRKSWTDTLQPGLANMRGGWGDSFDKISRKTKVSWRDDIRPAFQNIEGGLTSIEDSFDAAPAKIGDAWSRIKKQTADPVKWVVGNVFNNGIVTLWNKLANQLDLKWRLDPIKLAFAQGGVVPGGYSGVDNRIAGVRSGEAVMVPEFTRAVGGVSGVDYLNRLAERNALNNLQGFASGGVVDYKGKTFTAAMRQRIINAENFAGTQFNIFQGGFRPWTSYSGGTHGKDAIDYGPVNNRNVAAARQAGIIAWDRTGKGNWAPHIHGIPVPGGGVQLSPSALGQYQSYLRGGDGLGGSDNFKGGALGSFASVMDTWKKLDFEEWIENKAQASFEFMNQAGKILNKYMGKEIEHRMLNYPEAGRFGAMVAKMPGRIQELIITKAEAIAANMMPAGLGGPGTIAEGGAQKYAQSQLSRYGWGPGQWPALQELWTRESGWNHLAQNPSSGAYGIPQALPGHKMSSAGNDWRTNPVTQINWGLSYIADRHTSPSGALGFHDRNNWYAPGGPVQGPGTGTSDSIFARLSNGEYVIKKSAVDHYGTSFMDSVNNMRFASGGLVQVLRNRDHYRTSQTPTGVPDWFGGTTVNVYPRNANFNERQLGDVMYATRLRIREGSERPM